MAIFVEVLFYAVDYCYTKRIDVAPKMPVVMNVLGLIFLVFSIALFVYSYRKDKKNIRIYAIEFLVLAALCPFLTYWYYCGYFGLKTSFIHGIKQQVLWIGVLVYYIVRCIVATISAYKNSNARKLKKKKA